MRRLWASLHGTWLTHTNTPHFLVSDSNIARWGASPTIQHDDSLLSTAPMQMPLFCGHHLLVDIGTCVEIQGKRLFKNAVSDNNVYLEKK